MNLGGLCESENQSSLKLLDFLLSFSGRQLLLLFFFFLSLCYIIFVTGTNPVGIKCSPINHMVAVSFLVHTGYTYLTSQM